MSVDGVAPASVGNRRDGHACKGTRGGSARKQGTCVSAQSGRAAQWVDRDWQKLTESLVNWTMP
jgi:hypothetical protein